MKGLFFQKNLTFAKTNERVLYLGVNSLRTALSL